jgi:hypothetical protein
LTPEGHWLAAILAAGPGAVLSHRSAAVAWRVLPSGPRLVEVTTRSRAGLQQGTLRAHRNRLASLDVTSLRGLPVTTLPRTLLDLAEIVPASELMRALDGAVRQRLYDRRAVEAVIARSPGRRGLKPLRAALLALHPGAALTRSAFERCVLPLLEAHAVPRPEVNVRVAGYEVDLLWRAERLVVELDGRAFHASPAAFRDDRRRDADLQAAGYRVLRFTWHQIDAETAWVVTRIRQLLA